MSVKHVSGKAKARLFLRTFGFESRLTVVHFGRESTLSKRKMDSKQGIWVKSMNVTQIFGFSNAFFCSSILFVCNFQCLSIFYLLTMVTTIVCLHKVLPLYQNNNLIQMRFGREATLSKRKRDLSEKYDHYANILDLAKHFSV